MSQSVTQSLLLLAVAVALFPTPSPAQLSGEELLAIGKATLVSEVEPGLPGTPFEAWLAPLVGPGAYSGLRPCSAAKESSGSVRSLP